MPPACCTVQGWGNIVFTDESRFALKPYDNSLEERMCKQSAQEHYAFGRGRLMIIKMMENILETDLSP